MTSLTEHNYHKNKGDIMFTEINYIDSLAAPDGYKLERITATTYSLEPSMIFLLNNIFEVDKTNAVFSDLSNKKTLLSFFSQNALKNTLKSNRLRIFYQKDKFNYNLKDNINTDFSAVIAKCCIPVKKDDYAFHPKIILAEYSKDNEIRERIIVSSRNLTCSNNFETQIIAERTIDTRLDDYDNYNTLAEHIEKQNWTYKNNANNNGNISIEIFCQSSQNNGYEKQIFTDAATNIIVISPFFSQNYPPLGNTACYQSFEDDAQNLHSKMYCVTKNEKSELWIGSANCTHNGLNKNYECMAKLGFDRDISGDFKTFLKEKEIKPTDKDKLKTIDSSSDNNNILETFINNHTFTLKEITESDSSNKLVFEITPVSPVTTINGSDIKVHLMTIKTEYCISKNTLEFSIPTEDISNALVLKDKQGNQRIVFAECNDNVQAIIDKTYKSLANKKIKTVFPNIRLSLNNNQFSNNSNSNTNNKTISSSHSDKDYENIIKCYINGETDFLKLLKNKINKNESCFENSKIILDYLEALTNDEHNKEL